MTQGMIRDAVLQTPLFVLIASVVLIFFIPTLIAVMKNHSHKAVIVSTSVGGFFVALVFTCSLFIDFGAQFFRIGLLFVALTQFFFETGIYFIALFWLSLLIWSITDLQKSTTASAISKNAKSNDEKSTRSN